VSAWISAPQALGVIVGLVLVTELFTDTGAGYAVLAVILLLTMVPIVLRTPEVPLAATDRPALTVGAIVRGVWISPRRHPDFAWTLLGRVLVNIGNALGTGLLFYFLEFGLGVADPDGLLLQVTLVYLVAVVGAALFSGARSDSSLRRKPYVVVSAALIAVAGLVLAFAPSIPTTFVGAGLLGLGYGAFLAVDQALATQVLPDAANRGKDLGIMNVATAVPQALAPLGGAALVSLTQGFTTLFLVSGIAALLGALCMVPIRSVR
jgi:MFS family permease